MDGATECGSPGGQVDGASPVLQQFCLQAQQRFEALQEQALRMQVDASARVPLMEPYGALAVARLRQDVMAAGLALPDLFKLTPNTVVPALPPSAVPNSSQLNAYWHHLHQSNFFPALLSSLQQQQSLQKALIEQNRLRNIMQLQQMSPEEPKPNHSYIGLISMAILSSAEKKLVLSDIYQWILNNYSYFRTRGPGWRNSIRHNLSLNDCFIKAGRSANGKGHYWAIHPANVDDFKRGDFRRRRAQRKVRRHMGLSVGDEDEDDDLSPVASPAKPAFESAVNAPHLDPDDKPHLLPARRPVGAFDVESLLGYESPPAPQPASPVA